MASSSQGMLAGIDTAVSAEDPGEGEHTSMMNCLISRKKRKMAGCW